MQTLTTEDVDAIAEAVVYKLRARQDRRYGQRTITKAEAARRLGVHVATIYRWLENGQLNSGGRGVTLDSLQKISEQP